MYYYMWRIHTDDPGDTISHLIDRLHHIVCKAQMIRRAHR